MKLFLLISLFCSMSFGSVKSYVLQTPVEKDAKIHFTDDLLVALGATKMRHFNYYVAGLNEQQAEAFKKAGFKVEINHRYHTLGQKSHTLGDVKAEIPWGVKAIEAPKAQEIIGGSGEGVTVCVVDTGIAGDHPDLAGTVIGGIGVVKSTAVGKEEWYDDMGHGTHVSGTIAAHGQIIGVAPKAKLYAIKVLDASGSGSDSDVADGIVDCIGHGQVINMSLGGAEKSDLLQKAIQQAKAAGIQVACAAGNDGGPVGYPAAYPECTTVSAVDQASKLAVFSSFGPEVAFAAPGVGIKSTIPGGGYDVWDGTSMATPHVAGAFAAMLSSKKTELKAVDIGLTKSQQGAGLVDSYLTVK